MQPTWNATGSWKSFLRIKATRDGDVAQQLDDAYAAAKARCLPLLLESASDRQQRLATVIRRDIPALIDLCDGARRQSDGSSPFFETLDSRIDALLDAAGLHSLEPRHGEAYDPSTHIALDLVETFDPSLKDHVESCRYRGYELDGELLKKSRGCHLPLGTKTLERPSLKGY